VPFRFPGRAEAATPQGDGRGESRPTREDGTSVGRGDRAGGVQKRPDCRGTVAKPARGRGVPKRGRDESEDAGALEGRGTKGGGRASAVDTQVGRDDPGRKKWGRDFSRREISTQSKQPEIIKCNGKLAKCYTRICMKVQSRFILFLSLRHSYGVKFENHVTPRA
jgi:hypothetical protein